MPRSTCCLPCLLPKQWCSLVCSYIRCTCTLVHAQGGQQHDRSQKLYGPIHNRQNERQHTNRKQTRKNTSRRGHESETKHRAVACQVSTPGPSKKWQTLDSNALPLQYPAFIATNRTGLITPPCVQNNMQGLAGGVWYLYAHTILTIG